MQRSIQKKLHQLINSAEEGMLRQLAASIKEEVEEEPGDDASAVELYDFIMEFVRSDKLMSLEDEGMSSLLILNDLILELQQQPKANEAEPIQSAEETAEPQVGATMIQMDSQQSISSQGSDIVK
uniref:Uncharacterized protein n=1 Tax=Knipowitschia caucasica TaxID=637954 RepID=A0AAV2KWB1_KNICA